MPDQSVSEAIAIAACHPDLPRFDAAARAGAVRAVVDTVSVAFAGAREPVTRSVVEAVQTMSPGTSDTFAGPTVSPWAAALIDGAAAHALDYDDAIDELKGHPSAVVIPAILAAADRDTTGTGLLEAYHVGLGTIVAIAAGVDIGTHFASGWHSTATIGIFGAVAAIARIRHLDVPTTTTALSIAASMAAGTLQNFGTATKPTHAGLAAADAVLAVTLAAAGIDANPHAIDGEVGYFATHVPAAPGRGAAERAIEALSLPQAGINIKRFPNCSGTHWAVEAILELAPEIDLETVERIDITVEPRGLVPLIHHRPVTPSEARFSMEYAVAAASLDGRLDLASFTPEAIGRPTVRALLPRIVLHEAERPPLGPAAWDRHYAVVEVTSTSAPPRSARVDVIRGVARRPLTDAEVDAKALDCLLFAGFDLHARRRIDRLWDIGSAPSALDAVFDLDEPSTAGEWTGRVPAARAG